MKIRPCAPRCAIRAIAPTKLDHARALALDLPIGFGLIESDDRHVVHAVCKLAGAWWTEANTHARGQLRTLRANLL